MTAAFRNVEAATLARDGPPPITRTTFPTCRAHYPGGSSRCACRLLPRSCSWGDVDLDGASLRVEQSLEQTKAGLRFKSPKTRHGRRSISLPPSAVAVVRDHWKAQQELRLKLGMGKAPPESLVFATWEGKPRSPNSLTKEWKEAIRATKLPRVTLHSLRHTHASHLIASGLDVLAISRRLGHGSPTITLGVYGHLFANADDRAADAIEATFAAARREP